MRADVNGDHIVNILDLSAAAAHYLQAVPPSDSVSGLDLGLARLNQNADAIINILDLSTIAARYMHNVAECP